MSDFKFNKCDDYTIILTNRSYVPYGHIANYKVDDINFKKNMNSADEFSFTVYKYMTLDDGTEYEEPLWDKISNFKLIYVKETNTYYEIKVSGTDALATYKTIDATSLCEAELSQWNLHEMEINTEDDIARDDYVQPTLFYRSLEGLEIGSDAYNVAKNSSLLHRILWGSGKAKNYTIKHVDESIANLQKTFSIDGQSIYDFLTGDCVEQFNCLFVFDSTDRSISVYDLYSVCMNDDCSYRLSDKDNPNHLRYRGDFKDVCPKCGSKHIKVYGEDTMVIVDKENLTDEISFTTNSDELKNCFHLKAGDDDITAAVINLNPNGTSYLYYVPDYQKEDMSQNLVDKINSYDKLYVSYADEYEQLMLDMYTAIDWELYYMDEMMPGAIPPDQRESAGSTEIVTKPVETAEQQIPKLSVNNLNYTALYSITSSTSLSTVESAIKNYAKVFVNTSKFKIETIEGLLGSVYQSGGNNCVKWTGKFKVTNFSDKDDTATSLSITLTIYDNYEEFVNQKIKKCIATDDSTGSIYDVLKIDDLGKYKEAIKLYGIVRLQSFIESIKNVEDILIQQGNQAQELYYGKYHNMEIATEKELDARQVQYDAWIDKETKCSTRKSEIQEVLNFENYLGSELYGEFCAYRRDQDYSNDNYISDGLNNTDLFSNAREFIKTAQEELKKAATLQCNISCKVKNLFALDEFKPFWDSFQIGNWITVRYDNEYYRLRVISINGSLSDFSNIDVEFSSVTRISDVTTNIKDVLNQAQSMATNYSYISRQSNNGQKANDTLSEFQKKSINAALYMIKNNDEEGITIDNHGITARAWNDILGDFDPEQLIITHNVLGFTDDNFASLKTALGKVLMPDGTYKYGLNAEVVMGTFLLGKYLELQNENGSLKFNGDGFVITNGVNTFTVNPNNKEKLLSLSNNGSDILWVDSNGKLYIRGEGAGLDISTNKTITGINGSIDELQSNITQTADAITAEVTRATDAEGELQSNITQTANSISAEVNRAQKAEGQLDASLQLKLGRDENDQVISMINASADEINLKGNRLTVDATNFSLTKDGTATMIDAVVVSTLRYAESEYGSDFVIIETDGKGLLRMDIPKIYNSTDNNHVHFEGTPIVDNPGDGIQTYLARETWCNSKFATPSDISSYVSSALKGYAKSGHENTWFGEQTFNTDIKAPCIRDRSSTAAANVRCQDSTYYLATSAKSSRRYKHDIADISKEELNPERLYNLPVRQFIYNLDYIEPDDQRYGETVCGFIAEEVEKIYPVACEYNANSTPENWDIRYIIPPMLALIQNQHKEIERLNQDNISLKGEVDILKQRLEKMEEMLDVINSKIN